MTRYQLTYGAFALTYGCGTELARLPTGESVYFQPGDDSDAFRDELEHAQNVAPTRPIADILAELWRAYQP